VKSLIVDICVLREQEWSSREGVFERNKKDIYVTSDEFERREWRIGDERGHHGQWFHGVEVGLRGEEGEDHARKSRGGGGKAGPRH
jgi:hypothetical protein